MIPPFRSMAIPEKGTLNHEDTKHEAFFVAFFL